MREHKLLRRQRDIEKKSEASGPNENQTPREIEQGAKEKVDEEVFKKSYIPRNLFEVVDIERDIKKIRSWRHQRVTLYWFDRINP